MQIITSLLLSLASIQASIKVRGTVKTEPLIKGGLGSLTIDGTVGKSLVFEKDVGDNVQIKGTIGDDVKFAESLGDNVIIRGTIGSKTQFLGTFGEGSQFIGVTQENSIVKDSFPPGSVFNGQYTKDNKGNLVVLSDKVFASKHVLYAVTEKSVPGHIRANTATFEKTPGSGIIFEKPIGDSVVFKGQVGNNVIFKGPIGSNVVFEADIPSGTTLESSYQEGTIVKQLSNTSTNTHYAPPSVNPGKTTVQSTNGKKEGDKKGSEKIDIKDAKDGKDKKEDEKKTTDKSVNIKNSKNAAVLPSVSFPLAFALLAVLLAL